MSAILGKVLDTRGMLALSGLFSLLVLGGGYYAYTASTISKQQEQIDQLKTELIKAEARADSSEAVNQELEQTNLILLDKVNTLSNEILRFSALTRQANESANGIVNEYLRSASDGSEIPPEAINQWLFEKLRQSGSLSQP